MVDVIFSAPDLPALVQAASAMGFYKTPPKGQPPEAGIISNGPIPGGGSWAYNYVGTVYTPTGDMLISAMPGRRPYPEMEAQPGVWGRIRHNGDPKWLPTLPEGSGVTLYTLVEGVGWTADGKTPAPDWVGNIGAFL